MCSPTLALMAVGTLVTSYGQYQQGKAANQQLIAQQQNMVFQSKIDERNAEIQDYKANDIVERGEIEAKQRRLEMGRDVGDQKALLAANGVDVSAYSSLDIISDTVYHGELDALTIKDNAKRSAFAHELERDNLLAEADMKKNSAGSIKLSNPLTQAAGTIAGGGAKFYAQGKQDGVF